MKCRRCKGPAVIDVRRHNAGFCRDCFLHHCREQVRKAIEEQSPGSKHAFYFGFLEKASPFFTPEAASEQEQLQQCARCGTPTTAEVCAFCRLVERARK